MEWRAGRSPRSLSLIERPAYQITPSVNGFAVPLHFDLKVGASVTDEAPICGVAVSMTLTRRISSCLRKIPRKPYPTIKINALPNWRTWSRRLKRRGASARWQILRKSRTYTHQPKGWWVSFFCFDYRSRGRWAAPRGYCRFPNKISTKGLIGPGTLKDATECGVGAGNSEQTRA